MSLLGDDRPMLLGPCRGCQTTRHKLSLFKKNKNRKRKGRIGRRKVVIDNKLDGEELKKFEMCFS